MSGQLHACVLCKAVCCSLSLPLSLPLSLCVLLPLSLSPCTLSPLVITLHADTAAFFLSLSSPSTCHLMFFFSCLTSSFAFAFFCILLSLCFFHALFCAFVLTGALVFEGIMQSHQEKKGLVSHACQWLHTRLAICLNKHLCFSSFSLYDLQSSVPILLLLQPQSQGCTPYRVTPKKNCFLYYLINNNNILFIIIIVIVINNDSCSLPT